jgi:hypothetical protein
MLSRRTVPYEHIYPARLALRTFVPHASAIAVAATTDMMRVFLWVVTSSWATMMVDESALLP